MALVLSIAIQAQCAAADRTRSQTRDAIFRAYVLDQALRRQRQTDVFDSPFRIGPQSRPVPPEGLGSMVVPNR